MCIHFQILRRSLSNIKDCSTAGSDSNGPTVVGTAAGSSSETAAARRSSAARSVGIAGASSAHAPISAVGGRPRVARRQLTDNAETTERPIASRVAAAIVQGEATPARPERRSCSLDSRRSATRKGSATLKGSQGLSASALLAESTGILKIHLVSCLPPPRRLCYQH